jgi:hypothetical protein
MNLSIFGTGYVDLYNPHADSAVIYDIKGVFGKDEVDGRL